MSAIGTDPPQSLVLVPPPEGPGAPPLHNPGVWNGGGARSLRDLVQDPEVMAPVPWDLEPYTAPGRLTLLSAPPKAGKTTLTAHYAGRRRQGQAVTL